MTAPVDQDAACVALGVDAFGLERLIATGDLSASGAPGARTFGAAVLETACELRARRRADALDELARIDGPHLGGPERGARR